MFFDLQPTWQGVKNLRTYFINDRISLCSCSGQPTASLITRRRRVGRLVTLRRLITPGWRGVKSRRLEG